MGATPLRMTAADDKGGGAPSTSRFARPNTEAWASRIRGIGGSMNESIAGDLLRGAEKIGEELYGPQPDDEARKKVARKVYHNQKHLPVFTLPNSTLLLAFRSRLREYLEAQSAAKERHIADVRAAEVTKPKARRRRRDRRANPQEASA
jgi:hypothetical protein